MIALLLTNNTEHAVLMAAQGANEGIMPLWPQHLMGFPPPRARLDGGLCRLQGGNEQYGYREIVAELLQWCDEVWLAKTVSDDAATELNLFREEMGTEIKPIRFFTTADLAEARKLYAGRGKQCASNDWVSGGHASDGRTAKEL